MKKKIEKIITASEIVRNLAPLNKHTAFLFWGFRPEKVIKSWRDKDYNLHLILKDN